MVFGDLLNKNVRVTYVQETNDVIGELRAIDTETNSIHVHTYYNSTDLIIPLISVKSISEKF